MQVGRKASEDTGHTANLPASSGAGFNLTKTKLEKVPEEQHPDDQNSQILISNSQSVTPDEMGDNVGEDTRLASV